MTFAQFHNGLRILASIDRVELLEAGVRLSLPEWEDFRDHPHRWFTRAPDEIALKIWAIIERRQPARLRVCP